MKCGICGNDKVHPEPLKEGMRQRAIANTGDLVGHKRVYHPEEYRGSLQFSRDRRVANEEVKRKQESIESAARQEGREALAMSVVTRIVSYQGIGPEGKVVYGMHDTSELRSWYLRDNGSVNFGRYGEARLMDVEHHARYTGLQNQIDAQQMQLLSLAFEAGPEIMVEHLEAVEASGEAAVKRLRSE